MAKFNLIVPFNAGMVASVLRSSPFVTRTELAYQGNAATYITVWATLDSYAMADLVKAALAVCSPSNGSYCVSIVQGE